MTVNQYFFDESGTDYWSCLGIRAMEQVRYCHQDAVYLNSFCVRVIIQPTVMVMSCVFICLIA